MFLTEDMLQLGAEHMEQVFNFVHCLIPTQ
jgi:hypothetical protein